MARPLTQDRRLNIRMSMEEMLLLQVAADLYVQGNVSELVRQLALSLMPQETAKRVCKRKPGTPIAPLRVFATQVVQGELRA